MSVRTLNWYEKESDAEIIEANKWNLQLAKPVASGTAAPTYNMIWKSRALAPDTSVSWKVEYGLSWTAQVPNEGVSIRIKGHWQACNKGESFDINHLGYWQRSTDPADPNDAGWLKVGKIQYSYPGTLGIHIVVGVLNAETNQFEAIFVDPTTLPASSSARYQPQETVSWWLEGGDRTGSVFSGTRSDSCTQNFTDPSDPLTNKFEWSTSYRFIPPKDERHWTVAPGAPPQVLNVPPPSAELAPLSLGGEAPTIIQFDYARWLVTFSRPMAAAALAAAATSLYTKLKGKFKKVEIFIEGTDGTKLRVMYEPGTLAFPLGAADGPVATIDEALRDMLRSGYIPAGETWRISSDTTSNALDLSSLSNTLPSSTSVVRHAPQTAESTIPGNESVTFPKKQQQQSNGDTAIPKGPFNEAHPNGIIAI